MYLINIHFNIIISDCTRGFHGKLKPLENICPPQLRLGRHWFSQGDDFPCYSLVQSIFIVFSFSDQYLISNVKRNVKYCEKYCRIISSSCGDLNQVLEEVGVLKRIKRCAGTSSGSLVALMITLGYTSEEIRKVARMDFRDFYGL